MTIVGVDVSAIPEQPRGAGRYVFELVRALGQRNEVELRLETRKDDASRWAATAPTASIHAVVPASRVRRLAWEQIAAPRFVDRWGIDVFHGPHYTMPEIAKCPKVVTVHDLTFFDRPELHEKVKVSFFSRAIRVAAKMADAVICVSEPTAQRLRELLEPTAAVHVIPHGIDHDRFTPDDGDGKDAERLRELGVPEGRRYIAFAATLEPRKDLVTLVNAFERVAARDDEIVLVVAGGRGWGADAFEKAVARSPYRDRIIRPGYVSDDALPALMRHAAAFVYAAFEEGFGLPVLEALACGAPTITTTGSVMDQLAAGAALTTEAGDVGALTSCLEQVLAGDRDEARQAHGLEVARAYTWDACAAAHERVYRDVSAP